MAKKVTGYIKLQIPAGKATPAPPVGPALGQHGVNIVEFTKQFNAKTADKGDLIIPVVITVYADRSFSFITKTPPAAVLIKKACNIKSGSGVPNKTKVATISKDKLREIAETKMPDLNAAMGLSQIENLNHKLKLRDAIGKIYEQALQQSRNTFVPSDEGMQRYYSDFPVIVKSGLKDAIAYLKKNKVEAVRPYAYPLHQYLNLPKENFVNTEHFYLKTILIPNYSSLTKDSVTHITKVIATML